MNLNKKEKELLMYCVLAFAAGYLMCMYFPVHRRTNGYTLGLPLMEGQENRNNNNCSGTVQGECEEMEHCEWISNSNSNSNSNGGGRCRNRSGNNGNNTKNR